MMGRSAPRTSPINKPVMGEAKSGYRCLVGFVEVEGGEVHLASVDDVDGEEGPSGGELKFDEVGGEIPVVPLAPCDRGGGVVGGGDVEFAGCRFAVYVD